MVMVTDEKWLGHILSSPHQCAIPLEMERQVLSDDLI